MYTSIKIKIIELFFIYTFVSLISFILKMNFYPEMLVILSLPIIYIRFKNTMINLSITIGIIFLIIFSLYFFWNNYMLMNILAYVVSLILLVVVYIDYINVVATYEAFNGELISEDKTLYFLNNKFVLLEVIVLGSFFISLLIKFL